MDAKEPRNDDVRLRLGLADLERRFRADAACPSEEVLAEYPDLARDPDAALEVIYTEHVMRQERGEEPTLQEWTRRFPQWHDELRKLLDVHHLMTDPAPASRTTGVRHLADTWRPHDSSPEPLPSRLGDYEILELLGRGGMGVVYRARQRGLDRIVALKCVAAATHAPPEVLMRFAEEAKAAAALQHPHIAQIFEVGASGDTPYFSMEYVSGGNLATVIQARPLAPRDAAVLLEQLARAIHHAHLHGVIHRDLKPANVLIAPANRSAVQPPDLDESGSAIAFRCEPKIVDFGLAKRLDDPTGISLSGQALGTPSYMAPEQVDSALGPTGPGCDIYALGAVLYEVLVGRPPFNAASMLETLRQVRQEEPLPPRRLQPQVARDLETICLTCLQKESAKRYASAEALADDLARFLNGRPIQARAAGWGERARKWARRRPALAALVVATVVGLIGVTTQWVRAEFAGAAERRAHQASRRSLYAHELALANHDLESSQVERAQRRLEETLPEFRDWEWTYLQRQCHQARTLAPRLPQYGYAVAMSPDGKLVAAAGGRWGYDESSTVRVWEVDSGKVRHEFAGHPSTVLDLKFSPDGAHLASVGTFWSDRRTHGGVRVWNLADGELRFIVSDVNAISADYDPDGDELAIGLSTGVIRVVRSDSGETVRKLIGNQSHVLKVAYSPDGNHLASAGRDGALRIWDPATGKLRVALEGLRDVRCVDWSPNGWDLAIGTYGGSMRTYRFAEDSLVETTRRDEPGPVQVVRYSPDGQYLLVGAKGKAATLLHVDTGQEAFVLFGHNRYPLDAAFSADGETIATTGIDGTVRLWEGPRLTSSARQSTLFGADVMSVAVDPKSPRLALALGLNTRHPAVASGASRIVVYNAEHHQIEREIPAPDWLTSIAYNQDGTRIVAGGKDHRVTVWNSEDGSAVNSFSGHEGPITGVSFARGGTRVVSSSRDGSIRVWKLESGETEYLWRTEGQAVVSMAVAPDDRRLAASSADGSIRLWDLERGLGGASVPAGGARRHRLVFSPDGTQLAAAKQDGEVELWDVETLRSRANVEPAFVLRGHTEMVSGIIYHPQGRRLATSSSDQTVKVWDTQAGQELLSLQGSHGGNSQIWFTSDGARLGMWDYNLPFQWDSGAPRPLDETAWHSRELQLAKEARNHSAEAYHLTWLIERVPNQVAYLRRLGLVCGYRGDWERAAANLQQAVKLDDRWDIQVPLARALLRLGRLDEYKAVCRYLLELPRDVSKPGMTNAIAWICALSPDSGIDCGKFVEDLRTIANLNSSADYGSTLALAWHRIGEDEQAARLMKEAVAMKGPDVSPFVRLAWALSLQALGDITAAQEQIELVHSWLLRQRDLWRSGQPVDPAFTAYGDADLRWLLEELEGKQIRGDGT